MWKRLLGISFSCFIASGNLLADERQSGEVELILTQKPDIDCDGVPEKTDRVAPGSCMIYEIQALNMDDKVHRNILVSTRIPEHSILVHPYARLDDGDPVDSIIKQGSNGIRLLKTRLDTLQPGPENKVTLRYSVRVL